MRGTLPDTHGYLRALTIPDPGAGNVFYVGAIADRRVRLVVLRFKFVCDATVISRRVSFLVTDVALTYSLIYADGVVLAASTSYYNLLPGFGSRVGSTLGNFFVEWPADIWLTPTMFLTVSADNLQAGDAFSNIYCYEEEWLVD
jgi:hypothetical protein